MRKLTATQIAANFWRRVHKDGPRDCWEWQASKHKQGYGSLGFGGKTYLAHRVAWKLRNGEIPPEMMVCHTCDNPPCCNPRHLFLGTRADNMQDMYRKNRSNHPRGDRTGGRVASKLGWKTVKRIRALYTSEKFTHQTLATKFNVSRSTISRIINHQLWSNA